MSQVTVYILNYNYGKYISKAIESVLAQTYKDIELIIIDDGSTDHSIDIIKRYAEFATIVQQSNIGLVKSILKAFSMANGEYVMRLDADDWLLEGCIEELVKKITLDRSAALVFPDYYEVDEFGQIIRQIKRHDFTNNVTLLDQPAHGACTLIRKEYYFAVGGHDDSLMCQDGVDIWLSLTERYQVVNVSKPLFYYRKHGQSLTTDEGRILSTKSDIYRKHAIKRGYSKETTFAFVPVRSQQINGVEYSSIKLGNKTVLEWVVEKTKRSDLVDKTIILVETPDLADFACQLFSDEPNIVVSERNNKDARQGVGIENSIIDYLSAYNEVSLENIIVLTVNYPFSRHNYIDSAIYSMFLFGSQSVDSVIMDNSIFYYHDGSGLKQWIDNYIRKERDDIYMRRGGISVFKKNTYLDTKRENPVKMGHVIVDKISSFEIRSGEDLEIANFMAEKILQESQ